MPRRAHVRGGERRGGFVRPGRRRSNVRWVCATAAPWALAAGWLVSFTASAGQDFQSGISAALPNATAPLLIGSLVPPSGVRLGGRVALPPLHPHRPFGEGAGALQLP